MPLRARDYARLLSRLRHLLGNRCTRLDGCHGDPASPAPLQFAHLAETPLSGHNGRGLRERYLDILRHPDSYALLCQVDHLALDMKALDPALCPSIAEIALSLLIALPVVRPAQADRIPF